MDSERLFLATLDELARYVAIGDDYAMLRAAALLRQVLMDEFPLMHQVNRAHHLKVTFPVCGRRYTEVVLEDDPAFFSALGGIHRSGPASRPEMLSLDHFLATKVLKLGPTVLTVGDLISISANVLGGVHKGIPQTEEEQVLQGFSRVVGRSITAAQMRPVVLVALEGLAPLAQAVRSA